MNNLLLFMSILCFIPNLFWFIANVTGPAFMQILAKIIAVFGTVLPIIYWMKLLQII